MEGLELLPRPHVYSSLFQESNLSLVFVVRAEGELSGIIESLSLGAANPDLPLYAGRTTEEVAARGTGERRFATSIAGAFSLAAVLLVGLGVHGVTSYSVSGERGRSESASPSAPSRDDW